MSGKSRRARVPDYLTAVSPSPPTAAARQASAGDLSSGRAQSRAVGAVDAYTDFQTLGLVDPQLRRFGNGREGTGAESSGAAAASVAAAVGGAAAGAAAMAATAPASGGGMKVPLPTGTGATTGGVDAAPQRQADYTEARVVDGKTVYLTPQGAAAFDQAQGR